MKIQSVNYQFGFNGKPKNFAVVNKTITRSAQPLKDDFIWLKDQGVTDIINFRFMTVSAIDFNEEEFVKSLGMNYHNIPSITSKPSDYNVAKFLDIVDNAEKNSGKVHIHCKAGADRTGMYSFIYKILKGLGTVAENEKEWIERGHDIIRYPELRDWAKSYIERFK